MVACSFPATAVTLVGAFAIVDGIVAFEALLTSQVHTPFLATTVNVYETPFVNPGTVIGLHNHVAATFHGDDVTIYSMMPVPPSYVAPLNAIVAS